LSNARPVLTWSQFRYDLGPIWGMHETMSDVLGVITIEARAHRTVMIDGVKKDGTKERREIEPYSVRDGKDEDLLFFFCLKRQEMRSLLLSNILSAKATGNSFEPRYEIEL
jgi:predicted DNA-binding transcriptional regulator YafY